MAGDLTVQLNTSQVFALVGCYDSHVSNFQFLLRIPSILIEEEQKKRFLLQKIPCLFLLTSFLKPHVFVHKFWQDGICYNFVLQPENQPLILPKTLHVNQCVECYTFIHSLFVLYFFEHLENILKPFYDSTVRYIVCAASFFNQWELRLELSTCLKCIEIVNTLFLGWCCTLMSMQHIFNKVF